jgi:hypothetical protein
MFMAYHHTKFHKPNSQNSSVIAIKPKAKYRFQAAAFVVTHSIKQHLNKSCILSQNLLPYTTSDLHINLPQCRSRRKPIYEIIYV